MKTQLIICNDTDNKVDIIDNSTFEGDQQVLDYNEIAVNDTMSPILPDEYYDSIVIGDLDKFLISFDKIVPTLIKHLRLNGTIELEGLDFLLVCNYVNQGHTNIQKASELCFNGRNRFSDLYGIVNLLIQNGLNIIYRRYMYGYHYYIKAIRNGNKDQV